MQIKKIRILTGLMLLVGVLCGCGDLSDVTEDLVKDVEESIEREGGGNITSNTVDEIIDETSILETNEDTTEADNRYKIGDTAKFSTENSGKISVTLDEWGSVKREFEEDTILYVNYTIENIGEERVTVGNSLFDIYADNYSIGQTYYGDDYIMSADLSVGRKVDGTIYAEVNPDDAKVIEVEFSDAIFVIKDESIAANEDIYAEGVGGKVEGKDITHVKEYQDSFEEILDDVVSSKASMSRTFCWEAGENEDYRGGEVSIIIEESMDVVILIGNCWYGEDENEYAGLALYEYDDGTIGFENESGELLLLNMYDNGEMYIEDYTAHGSYGAAFTGLYHGIE